MVTLYKFAPAWGLPDLSPFVFKLETYLRMAKIPYKAEPGDPRKAPKKKLPYIEHDGKTLGGQGTGRHTPPEVDAIGKGLVTSIADQIEDGPFFLGEEPSSVDATAYAFLASLMEPPFDSNVKAHANALPQLRGYVDRMK